MTTVSWKNGVTGNWTDGSNWVGGSPPGPTDNASFPAASTPYVVTLDASESVAGVRIRSGATLTLASGHTLTTSSTITVRSGGVLDGVGVVNANGGFVGAGTIDAGPSGSLTLNGLLPSTMHLGVGANGDLVIGTSNTINAANLTLSGVDHETLTIDAPTLMISGKEDVNGASIVLNGGALTDLSGISLGGGSLTGFGVVTTDDSASTDFDGPGTVTASGGTLTFDDTVDGGGSSTATSYAIDAGATLAFDGGVGVPGLDPSITFAGPDATLDLTGEGTGESAEFFGVATHFAAGDKILVEGSGVAGDKAVYDPSSNTLYIEESSGPIIDRIEFPNTAIAGDPFTVTENGGVDVITICFFAGTRIRTPDGEAAVEDLKSGDRVMTVDGRSVAVNWVGKQTISMRFADPQRVLPIRVKAGALSEDAPSRDLLLSPDHALWIDGALVHASALVNGRSIVQETRVPAVFVYYHVETDDHSLILAENCPAETFVDNIDRLNFDNWAEYQALYPDGKTVEELPYPRAKSHRQVPVRVRVRLAERAQQLSPPGAEVA